MVSISVLVIGLSGFLQTIVTTSSMESTSSDNADAVAAARAAIERLRTETFSELFVRYNSTAADDPALGASPGPDFDVPGLQAMDDDADGLAGEILLPSSQGGAALREDLVSAEFGLPLDLNADGVLDTSNHSGDYRLLPVIVRIRWKSKRGPANFELRTVLGELP